MSSRSRDFFIVTRHNGNKFDASGRSFFRGRTRAGEGRQNPTNLAPLSRRLRQPESECLKGVSHFGLRFIQNWFSFAAAKMSSTTTANRTGSAPPPSEQLFLSLARIASGIALVLLGFVFVQVGLRTSLLGKPGLAEALLVFAVAIATLLTMARRLPGHKVLLSAAIVAIVGAGAHAIGAVTAIPFGPFNYTDAIGPKIFGTVAWAVPVIWIIVAFNARGVARLILKPWRKTKTYGFWVIGVATGLVVLFDLALEPFATKVARYWIWLPTKFPATWHGMPWINAFGWGLTAALMFAFATPFLINRDTRARKAPPDYHPLITWVLLLALFGTGSALEGLWSASVLAAVTAIGSTVLAVRGARW